MKIKSIFYFLTNDALRRTKYRLILVLPSTIVMILCMIYAALFNVNIITYITSYIPAIFLIFFFILVLSIIRIFIADTENY